MKTFYSNTDRKYIIPMVAILTLSLALMPAMATDAFAASSITIAADGEAVDLVVVDNDGNDASPVIGNIVVIITELSPHGCLTGSVDSLVTKPIVGSESAPVVDLLWSTTSAGPGVCNATISVTDTDFVNNQAVIMTGMGGTTEGTVDFSVWADETNTPYGESILIFNDFYDPAPLFGYTSEGTTLIAPGGSYSLSMVIDVSHDGEDQVSSGDAFLTGSPSVAGEIIPTNTTALVLAGLGSMSMWMIPTIAGLAGAGMYFIKFRK